MSTNSIRVNTTMESNLGDLSRVELFIQLFVFYLSFGLLSMLGNFLITLSLIRYSNRNTRFFAVVRCLTIWRTILSGQFAVVSIYRILRQFGVVSVYQTRFTCISVHLFFYTAPTIEASLLMFLAVDRILAIKANNFYRRLTGSQALRVCTSLSVLVLASKLFSSYCQRNTDEVIPCMDMHSPTRLEFNIFNSSLAIVLSLCLLIFYCFLYILVHQHINKNSSQERTVAWKAKANRNAKLVKMVRTMIAVHCSFELTSKIMLFAAQMVGWYSNRLVAYCGVLITINLLTNFIVLLWINAEIRRNFLKLLQSSVDRLSPKEKNQEVEGRRNCDTDHLRVSPSRTEQDNAKVTKYSSSYLNLQPSEASESFFT